MSVSNTVSVKYLVVPEFTSYRVGNDGSVWRVWVRIKRTGKRRISCTTWKKMKAELKDNGRLRVRLVQNGKEYRVHVHQLVLENFIGPCPEGMECCHNDDNPLNNKLDNLRWGTRQSNMVDKRINDKIARGENQGLSKITEEQVREIRRMYGSGNYSKYRLGKLFNIDRRNITFIVDRKTWKHVI